jgi:hypothetical protein
LAPGLREDLAKVHLVEVNAPVFISHPPGAVITEDVVEFLLEALVVVPGLVLISELAGPLALSPRVPYPHQLQAIDVSDVEDTVGVIEEDPGLARAVLLRATLVLNDVRAPEEETLLVILLQLLPEALVLDLLGDFWGTEVEFL